MDEDQSSVRALAAKDGGAAVAVINTAAEWYREFLGTDKIYEPEMTLDQWLAEARRMTWYGAFEGDDLIAVMGLEYVSDVALFRHAYVLPHRQRQGVASLLHDHLERQTHGVERIIVGTYAANYKARSALEKGGYRASPDPEAGPPPLLPDPPRPAPIIGDLRKAPPTPPVTSLTNSRPDH